MTNVAYDRLWPTDSQILARLVFLYVGQGSSTILLVADGPAYRCYLLDIHLDEALGGIDVPRLMSDLLNGGRLDAFINSHPHNDHTGGVEELHSVVSIDAVWHSGHIPSEDHQESYQELQRVIDKVIVDGGIEAALIGSRTPLQLGEVDCYVLSPAQHVTDDISDETPEGRDRRIHEQSVVLRVGSGETWAMLPGDADRDAWEKHIRYYDDYDLLSSQILAAAHHGSRTFFCYEEDDEPYLDGLTSINPEYVVISAPTQEESPHDHPHDLAVEHYTNQVGDDRILHTGAERHSFICDIRRDGQYWIESDMGELVKEYGLYSPNDGGEGQGSGSSKSAVAPSIRRGSPRDVGEAPPFA